MSLKGVVKGTVNRGLKKVGQLPQELTELGELRMKVCEACPLLKKASKRCTACGCYMKTKVLVKQAKCPQNKW
tara:strand:+ start:365 stop:583 length:219 start_codon:yes stop_codon:yes gene_type:complete